MGVHALQKQFGLYGMYRKRAQSVEFNHFYPNTICLTCILALTHVASIQTRINDTNCQSGGLPLNDPK